MHLPCLCASLPVHSNLTYPIVIVRIRSILEFVCFDVAECYLVHHGLVKVGWGVLTGHSIHWAAGSWWKKEW